MYIHGRFVRKMGMFKPCSDAFIKVSHYCPIAVQPLAHALRAPPAAPTGDVFAAAPGGTGRHRFWSARSSPWHSAKISESFRKEILASECTGCIRGRHPWLLYSEP